MVIKKLRIRPVHLSCLVILGLLVVILVAACSEDNPSSSTVGELLVFPQVVEDSSTVGVPNQTNVIVTVNCDPIRERMSFSFSCDSSWIDLSNLSGTNHGITSDSFSILYDVEGLPVGTYTGSVRVSSSEATNSPQLIEVNYTVKPDIPLLRIYPSWCYFYAETVDEVLQPDTFVIIATDAGHYNYTIDAPESWITLSKNTGSTPDTVQVVVDQSQLIMGAHVDTIWVHANELTNSPLSVVCSLFVHPWQLQTSQPQPPNWVLYDIEFADDQQGWAVGLIMDEGDMWSGYMMKTTDGGEQWQSVLTDVANVNQHYGLAAIDRVDDDMWIVGQSGIVRHSPDLGQTWYPQSTGLMDTVIDLNDVRFVSSHIGWIVGEGGLILKTTDGGDTWIPQNSGLSSELESCHFLDENTGWIVGNGTGLLRTTNGGNSWISMSAPSDDYKDICFVDAATGWMVGKSGNIFFSGNGGASWTGQESNCTNWLHTVFFTNNSVGWAAGGNGTVLYTDDGGTTWTPQVPGTEYTIYSVKFLDGLRGWIAGQRNDIRYTNSGGN